VDIETFARISATLMEGTSAEEALARHGIPAERWEAERARLTRALAEEAMQSQATPLGDAFAEALARARDELAPVPEMTAEQWASLVAAMATDGAPQALKARGLTDSDYLRLSRSWTRTLASDRSVATRYAQAFARATRKQ